MEDYPTVSLKDQAALSEWLETYHGKARGAWLLMPRKGQGPEGLTWEQVVVEVLRYGWIDGRRQGGAETHWRQLITPRSARSKWSEINTGKAEALITAGRMKPAGLAEVDRAKADGRWAAAYASQAKAEVPEDLAAALAADPAAKAAFAGLNSQNRYAILHRTHDAKTARTRAARIEKFVAMLARGEMIHPPRA